MRSNPSQQHLRTKRKKKKIFPIYTPKTPSTHSYIGFDPLLTNFTPKTINFSHAQTTHIKKEQNFCLIPQTKQVAINHSYPYQFF